MTNRFDNLSVDQLFDQIVQYCVDAQGCDVDDLQYELDKIRLLVDMIENRISNDCNIDE
jgi:hypothetical protein